MLIRDVRNLRSPLKVLQESSGCLYDGFCTAFCRALQVVLFGLRKGLRVIVRWLSSFMVPSRFSRRPIRVSVVTF